MATAETNALRGCVNVLRERRSALLDTIADERDHGKRSLAKLNKTLEKLDAFIGRVEVKARQLEDDQLFRIDRSIDGLIGGTTAWVKELKSMRVKRRPSRWDVF